MSLSLKNIPILLTFTAAALAAAAHRHVFTDSIVAECQFTMNDRDFDLCPLARGTGQDTLDSINHAYAENKSGSDEGVLDETVRR